MDSSTYIGVSQEGKELSKKAKQNVEKLISKQGELNAWLAKQNEEKPDYLAALTAEVARLTAELAAASKL